MDEFQTTKTARIRLGLKKAFHPSEKYILIKVGKKFILGTSGFQKLLDFQEIMPKSEHE